MTDDAQEDLLKPRNGNEVKDDVDTSVMADNWLQGVRFLCRHCAVTCTRHQNTGTFTNVLNVSETKVDEYAAAMESNPALKDHFQRNEDGQVGNLASTIQIARQFPPPSNKHMQTNTHTKY